MEMMYQYVWKHKLLPEPLATTDGRPLRVIYPGRHNLDSGPDFTGARLAIGGENWAGNVEVHVRASDWYRHHHDSDPAYSNVILHVVGISDKHVADSNGRTLPQTIATFSTGFLRLYALLAKKISAPRCEALLSDVSPLATADWMSSLSVERLQQKSQRILDSLPLLNYDWEQACFTAFARALGFGLNSDPFEILARSLPLRILAHHSDCAEQIEALIFGQAGMLDTGLLIFDEYYQTLCREYSHLARKYGLRPMRRDLWKYMRTRPGNFPQRRLALLAAALLGGFSLLGRLIDASADPDLCREIFQWRVSEYWKSHSDFDRPVSRLPLNLSQSSIDLLMINFAAPMLYAYAAARGDIQLGERALEIWNSLPPERNSIIRKWNAAGIACRDAADSQALIQLTKQYCEADRCLECRFGHALLRQQSKNR